MDTRASRYAMWRLHAPPSREADINPNPKKGGYPAPDRVTFLTGANRDFPNWRRQPSPSDQAPPMQRAAINQLSNSIALPNRTCIVQCRRKSRNIVALVPREGSYATTDATSRCLSLV